MNRQRAAIESAKAAFTKDALTMGTKENPAVVTFREEGSDYGYSWLFVDFDVPSLPDTNMLRFVVRTDSWMIHVGKGGKLTAHSYPHYLRDRKGKRVKFAIGYNTVTFK